MAQVSNVVVVIPAYRPGAGLLDLIGDLSGRSFRAIIVVDDGGGAGFADLFAQAARVPLVTVLRHGVNLGKGAALKTAMNHVLCEFPDSTGVVTADADGQHSAEDIEKVAARLERDREKVVLGVRTFTTAGVPLRSRFGNQLSVVAVHWLIGQKLNDTQTGLRGLPSSFLPHLMRMKSTGYEFELDMLIACKHQGYEVVQEPIATIYEDGNRSSHFNPLLDSLRIYFVLLRFGFISLLTSVIDNLVFTLAFGALGTIGRAQILGRVAAVAFNYLSARRAVFLSREEHAVTFPRYLLLVVSSGFVSYGLIQLLLEHTTLSPIVAKIAAEAMLFIANFAIQRDFVFRKQKVDSGATDWDRYYREVPATARFTRKYTENVIARALRRYCVPDSARPVLVELGGANSCFLDRLVKDLHPREYHVIDTNRHGLDLLERKAATEPIILHQESCLDVKTPLQADIALSIGLIEHFDPQNTRKAIRTHFELLRPGGWALISFPTPTLLYRITRGALTAAGLWRFPDERALQREEVMATVKECGELRYEKLLWPLMLTQHLMLVQKRPAS